MIEITEITPIKLSGRSSFLVKFDYREDIIAAIRTVDSALYHKNLKAWEVPITSLAQILDVLTFLDDIQLNILPDEENAIQEVLEPSTHILTAAEIQSFKFRPFKHQIDAINYGLQTPKWLLLDDMGLGKTLETMYLAETLYRRGEISHCLIICGVDSLRTNWKAEIKKFSNLDCVVLGEYQTRTGQTRYRTVKERLNQLINPISEFFIIVNIASIRDDKFIEAFSKSKNDIGMIIVDECHRCSNKSSSQGAHLLKLNAKYKVAVTGSLVTNNPESCYLPLSWTANEHATLTTFRSQYCTYGGFNNHEIIGYKNLNLLQDEINSCSLRRTFAQVKADMPSQTIEFETIEMSDEHAAFYEAVKNGVKEEVDKVQLTSNNLLALTTRLRQATATPSILTSNHIESSKVIRAAELVEDILAAGEKVVVFSTFLEPCDVLMTKLAKFHPLLATGAIPDDLVQQNIEKFRNSPDFNIIIGTHQKFGTGYSMPECHYCIMLDFPWTYYAFSQSCNRIYRITSDQSVFIKALCCADTIDERVRDIVESKKELQDYLVDGKENDFAPSVQEEMRNILLNL